MTGINTVIYYAPTIVEFTGVNSSAGSILAAVGVGVINVGFTILALRLLDRAGRRTMLMVGVTGMSISLFALGAAFVGGGGSTLASVVAIVSLMTYVASFAISLGPIFWLLNAEIYPLAVRSKAAGLGTMANWTFNFIVSLTFLLLIEAAGRSGAFWIYGGIGIVTLWFCWKFVPETKGKHLEDIQAYFQARVDGRARSRRSRACGSARYPPRMRIDEIIAARRPTFSVEFFPPEDRGGDRAALRDRARAARAGARLRLGHLRRRRRRPATARSRSRRR